MRFCCSIIVIGILVLFQLPVQAQEYFIRGDVDCNGVVDADDVVALYDFIMNNVSIKCLVAADVNASGGRPDIIDYTYLRNFIESSGPEPPAPFPLCGVDPMGGAVCEEPCFCAEGSNVIVTTRYLPAVQYEVPFSHSLGAAGGTPPYTWSLDSGSLPSGVSFTSDGTISGTPSETGEYQIRVSVLDDAGGSDEADLTLHVLLVVPPSPLSLFKKSVSEVVPGREISYTIVVENTGLNVSQDTTLVEFLEPWFTYVEANPTPATILALPDYYPVPEDPENPPEHDAVISWSVPPLEPGHWRVFSYSVDLDPTFPVGEPVRGTACMGPFDEDMLIGTCFIGYDGCVAGITGSCLGNPKWLECMAAGINGCMAVLIFCSGIALDKECVYDFSYTVAAYDPNMKEVVAPRYIQQERLLLYEIHFENLGTVEAQDVFIVDTLDDNLDDETLDIISSDGASYDPVSRELRWDLLGINLQPEATDHVAYAIRPLPGLPSGTEIGNTAFIQFEVFDIFETNRTLNTIDYGAPTGLMNTLPTPVVPLEFTLSWSGTDPEGEVDRYTILVSDNGGPFEEYLGWTQDTSTTFVGEDGHTYGFICIARDVAGNIEVQDPIAEIVADVSQQQACCGLYAEGISGNTNCSVDGELTLSDITTLIDHLYVSNAPLCCYASGNTNGSADCKITLNDITVLIDAIYISQTPPAYCMPECEQ